MNEVLLGLLGAALGLAFFACGFYFGRKNADVPKAAEITGAIVPACICLTRTLSV